MMKEMCDGVVDVMMMIEGVLGSECGVGGRD